MDFFKGNETKKILTREIFAIEDILRFRNNRLYILLSSEDKDKFVRLKNILKKYPGYTPVYFANKSSNQRELVLAKYKIGLSQEFLEEVVSLMSQKNIFVK